MLLPIHIAAGGLAIILVAVALSVKKGGTIHRRSGLLFVYAMLVMGVSASILSLLKGRFTPRNWPSPNSPRDDQPTASVEKLQHPAGGRTGRPRRLSEKTSLPL
jgi:hypothetical protein